MIDSTNPRVMADNIRHLSGESGSQASDILNLQTTVTTQGNALIALQTYDDEETATGETWTDGSSIYRIVISAKSPNATDGTFSAREVDFTYGIPINISGVCITSNSVLPFGYSTNAGYLIKISFAKPSSKLVISSNSSSFNGGDCYIIVEYVKEPESDALTSPAPDDTRSINPEEIPDAEDEPIEPEVIREALEEDPIEEPIVEVKKTTRKKSTN